MVNALSAYSFKTSGVAEKQKIAGVLILCTFEYKYHNWHRKQVVGGKIYLFLNNPYKSSHKVSI